jgi:hypothetical protein
MTPDARLAAVIAACWGAVVAVGSYAVVRAIQFFLYPDPNPATLVWSAHAGFFWRCWTCAYAGGIASFIAYALVRARPVASLRSLAPAIVIAAAMLAVQTALLP